MIAAYVGRMASGKVVRVRAALPKHQRRETAPVAFGIYVWKESRSGARFELFDRVFDRPYPEERVYVDGAWAPTPEALTPAEVARQKCLWWTHVAHCVVEMVALTPTKATQTAVSSS